MSFTYTVNLNLRNNTQLHNKNNPKSIHAIYPYRGKIAALDAEQILSQIPKGSVVLDPFCGSGTIVYEGLKFGHHTLGVDANPIAVMLSRGKIDIPEEYSTIENEVTDLIEKAANLSDVPKADEYSCSIFHEVTLDQIMRLSFFFNEMSSYLKAVFCGTVALTARGCNHYKWTSSTVGKNIEPKRYIDFYEKLHQKLKKHYLPIPNQSKVYYGDSRKLTDIIKEESVDFVFSSPPYFDCLDYTAYYARIIYGIIGIDRVAVRNVLIQTFENYREDMKYVLEQIHKVLKPDGKVIFVVGDKKIHGKVIRGADFLNEISPFSKSEVIERTYSGTSSQVFDKLNSTERKEQIVIWEK